MLIDRGYHISDVVGALAEAGVKITNATLRQYLKESARKRKGVEGKEPGTIGAGEE